MCHNIVFVLRQASAQALVPTPQQNDTNSNWIIIMAMALWATLSPFNWTEHFMHHAVKLYQLSLARYTLELSTRAAAQCQQCQYSRHMPWHNRANSFVSIHTTILRPYVSPQVAHRHLQLDLAVTDEVVNPVAHIALGIVVIDMNDYLTPLQWTCAIFCNLCNNWLRTSVRLVNMV